VYYGYKLLNPAAVGLLEVVGDSTGEAVRSGIARLAKLVQESMKF
jgi:hypothetical protein